jgi:hypothetical protein
MSNENVRGWFVIVDPITRNIHNKIEDTGTFESANRIMEVLRKGFSVRYKANSKYDASLQYLKNHKTPIRIR